MAENEWTTESRGPNLIRKKKIGGKGVDSIYEWGLPPDKMPGNRQNIPWTKGAEDAIGLDYDPAEAKALQKLLIQKLQVRLNEVKATFLKHKDLKGGKNEIAKLLKETDFNASQIFKHKNTESKAIRRALASMFSTDADFFAQKGVWNLLKTDLSRLEGEELFKVVKGLDASLSGEKGGLVGHHTTLSAVTNVMDKVDEKWRVDFNKLAKEDGWRIGERGLERIQPVTHKPFDTKKGFPNIRMVKGALAEKLAPLIPDSVFKKGTLEIVKGQHPKIDAFLDKMAEISTHGKGYGGTVGFSLDSSLANLSPQNAYNNARNLFAAEEAIQHQGKRLNVKLNKALKNFNFTNIDEAADFLLSKANQKDWQPAPIKSNLIAEAEGKLGPSDNPKFPGANVDYQKSQITKVPSQDVLDQKPYSLDTDNTWFKKGLLSTAAITGTSLWSAGKTLASTLVDTRDLLHPEITTNIAQAQNRIEAGEDPLTVIKEEGLESAGVIKDELLRAGGLITGLKVASQIPKLSTVVKGGTAVLSAPVAMKGLLAGAVYGGVNAYLKEKTGRSLNERVIMDTGYANLLKTNRVVSQEVGDDGVSREVVTYEKEPEVEENKWNDLKTYFENRNK